MSPDGIHPRTTEKTKIIISPNQNVGIERLTIAPVVAR